jgi:predicted RNA polymerase sigma factor
MIEGPASGLRELDVLAKDPRLAKHHRLDAVRAHLLERAGDRSAPIVHYQRAAARTTSTAERNHLAMRAARLSSEAE